MYNIMAAQYSFAAFRYLSERPPYAAHRPPEILMRFNFLKSPFGLDQFH